MKNRREDQKYYISQAFNERQTGKNSNDYTKENLTSVPSNENIFCTLHVSQALNFLMKPSGCFHNLETETKCLSSGSETDLNFSEESLSLPNLSEEQHNILDTSHKKSFRVHGRRRSIQPIHFQSSSNSPKRRNTKYRSMSLITAKKKPILQKCVLLSKINGVEPPKREILAIRKHNDRLHASRFKFPKNSEKFMQISLKRHSVNVENLQRKQSCSTEQQSRIANRKMRKKHKISKINLQKIPHRSSRPCMRSNQNFEYKTNNHALKNGDGDRITHIKLFDDSEITQNRGEDLTIGACSSTISSVERANHISISNKNNEYSRWKSVKKPKEMNSILARVCRNFGRNDISDKFYRPGRTKKSLFDKSAYQTECRYMKSYPELLISIVKDQNRKQITKMDERMQTTSRTSCQDELGEMTSTSEDCVEKPLPTTRFRFAKNEYHPCSPLLIQETNDELVLFDGVKHNLMNNLEKEEKMWYGQPVKQNYAECRLKLFRAKRNLFYVKNISWYASFENNDSCVNGKCSANFKEIFGDYAYMDSSVSVSSNVRKYAEDVTIDSISTLAISQPDSNFPNDNENAIFHDLVQSLPREHLFPMSKRV